MQTGLFILQVSVHIISKSNIGSGVGTYSGIGFYLINSWVCAGIHIRLYTNKPKVNTCPSHLWFCLLLQHLLKWDRSMPPVVVFTLQVCILRQAWIATESEAGREYRTFLRYINDKSSNKNRKQARLKSPAQLPGILCFQNIPVPLWARTKMLLLFSSYFPPPNWREYVSTSEKFHSSWHWVTLHFVWVLCAKVSSKTVL